MPNSSAATTQTGAAPVSFDEARQHQAGHVEQAVRLYRQLLLAEPNNAQAWYLMGAALVQLGKLDEARASLRQATSINPRHAAAHNQLGVVLAQQAALDEAIGSFRRALELAPDNLEALNNLGLALLRQDKADEAIASFQRALAIKPDDAKTRHNLDRAQPDLAEAHFNLGAAYSARRHWEEAASSYRQSLALRPNHVDAHRNLGNVLRELDRADEAVASFREALRLKPDFAEAHGDLAMALAQGGDLEGALASCREVLRLRPNLASAHLYMGYIYRQLGRRSEAVACCNRALELQPDLPDARRNRALVWLTEGKLAEGWAEYEWRWKCPEFPQRRYPQPLWDGSPLAGKTILLEAEQGFGDTLQFVRYTRLIRERGGTVLVACQRPLVELLSRSDPAARVLAQDDAMPPFEVQAPLLSLPRILGTTLETIPADVPYLKGDPQAVARWRDELGGGSELKIGIAWHGNRVHCSDRWRSMPLSCFAPLAALAGVRLYSLQKNYGWEQLAQASFRDRIVDLSPRLESFADTAAVTENLDLVICCDTSVAHLAGALARPVWVALPAVPDWRWLLQRDDSPWYPTMRLFRQQRRDDWRDVFDRITAALADQIAAGRPGRPGFPA